MDKYADLTPKKKCLEFILEVLNHSLTTEGIPEAKQSFLRLEELVGNNGTVAVPAQVVEARQLFDRFVSEYEGTTASVFSTKGYAPYLGKMRDLLLEVHDDFPETD